MVETENAQTQGDKGAKGDRVGWQTERHARIAQQARESFETRDRTETEEEKRISWSLS